MEVLFFINTENYSLVFTGDGSIKIGERGQSCRPDTPETFNMLFELFVNEANIIDDDGRKLATIQDMQRLFKIANPVKFAYWKTKALFGDINLN